MSVDLNNPSVSTLLTEMRLFLLPLEPHIQLGPWKPGNPDHAVSLTAYPIEDNADDGTMMRGLQVRLRGNATDSPLDMLDRQDAIWTRLCMTRPVVDNPAITIIVAWRQMGASLGLDAQGRPEIADTYYLRSDRLGLAG